jgi:hypothetical protein
MSIEATFPLTPTISFLFYGKIMFDLHIFDQRAHFQECNYHINREVAVLMVVYWYKLHQENHVLCSCEHGGEVFGTLRGRDIS